MTRVYVGTSGWADPSLIRCGRFYPHKSMTAEARLRHYASCFSMVEVNATYHALPARRTVERWAEVTPPGFVFNIKAFAALTSHPVPPSHLPRDLQQQLSPQLLGRERLFEGELPRAMIDELGARFVEVLGPLRASGKLGFVLLQFPPWVDATNDHARMIVQAARRVGEARVAVELRNRTWFDGDKLERTVAYLHRQGLSLVCVDGATGQPGAVRWSPVTDRRLAVLRLHGRARSAERPSLRYADSEIAAFSERAAAMACEADEVHVVFGNCLEDDAVANAAALQRALEGAVAALTCRACAAPRRAHQR